MIRPVPGSEPSLSVSNLRYPPSSRATPTINTRPLYGSCLNRDACSMISRSAMVVAIALVYRTVGNHWADLNLNIGLNNTRTKRPCFEAALVTALGPKVN